MRNGALPGTDARRGNIYNAFLAPPSGAQALDRVKLTLFQLAAD